MKKKYFIYLLLALVIAFGACNDPVFYIISVEPPIADPLIDGSPGNFVVFNNALYVASGRRIYSYDGTDWDLLASQPGGKILQLAATENYLYALCFQDSGKNSYLRRSSIDPSSVEWEDVTGETGGFNMLQSVYAANDRVFIGAERNTDRNNYFMILTMSDFDADTEFAPLTPGGTDDSPEHMLCGIAYDSLNYYLCTRGNTIFSTPVTGGAAIEMKADTTFTGIINLEIGDIITAISRNGNLYYVNSLGLTKIEGISFGNDRPSTGALAVWRETAGEPPKLLLAGRQDKLDYSVDSGYTYGYMELALDLSGVIGGINFVEPGTAYPSSVADNERYVSTIGKNPVNHIFQTPSDIDPEMILFASTQKSGVWSYRVRDGVPQWNAEE